MRILLTGATGFIGRHVLKALLHKGGHQIVAAVRSNQRAQELFPGVTTLQLDASECSASTLSNSLHGFDVVINTVGIIRETASQTFEKLHVDFPRCLVQACQQAGVKRFIHISALGAGTASVSAYHLSKQAADDYIRSSTINAVILQPSLVYGAGGTSTQLFAALAAQPVQILVEHGTHQVQPVHIDDVTEAIVRLTDLASSDREIELTGPEPIAFRDMLQVYRRWLGYGELRALSLSWPVVLRAARWTGPINHWVSEDNMRMLRQGNTGSASALTQLLGRPPRALQQALPPGGATDAERWHARLFLLLPLLRASIAFVWIFTGIVSLFLYPAEDSYELLAEVGLTGMAATSALYSAALLDIALGVAVLKRWRPLLTGLLQLIVIAGYTILISIFLSGYWLHPYGPVSKNLPMLAAILILMAVEKK